MIHGHTFTIDCSKILAYEGRAEESAQLLSELVKDESLMLGTVKLGEVEKTDVTGSELRIYVRLDPRIEHGTYQGGSDGTSTLARP